MKYGKKPMAKKMTDKQMGDMCSSKTVDYNKKNRGNKHKNEGYKTKYTN